jgi:hypothetical protein
MELANGEEDPFGDINDLEITLHALTGLGPSDSMMLQVIIDGVPFKALVDIRSTHTFIHSEVARHLGLQIIARNGLSVLVANDDRCAQPGCLRRR